MASSLRRRAVIGLFASFLAASLPAQVPEYEAKSEFLERFTRFIEWPSEAFTEDPGAPFVIGVLGRDPFGAYLDTLAASRPIKGRKVVVRRLAGSAESGACCHVLFISSSEVARVAQIVERTAGKPVLTVGDTSGYAEKGVLINLYEDRGRIGFEVNEPAVRRSGLRFNSKLMRLARLVGSDRP
jgi:hypothetical protein